MRRLIAFVTALPFTGAAAAEPILLRPARVFDGVNAQPHQGWSVLVDGDRITVAGPNLAAPNRLFPTPPDLCSIAGMMRVILRGSAGARHQSVKSRKRRRTA